VKTILETAGIRVDSELAKFIQESVDFATWNEGEASGVAFVQLARSGAEGPATRCVIRTVLEGLGAITVGARGTDAWEAVRRTGELLESDFIARFHRVTSLGSKAPIQEGSATEHRGAGAFT